MLIRESQRLDLQEVWVTQQAVDVNTQSMCGQFGIKPGTQAPEGMSVIDLNLEYLRELVVDGFDHLAHAIQKCALLGGHLYFLVAARQRHQANAIVGEKLGSFVGTDVSLITQNAQISMFAKHFKTHLQIVDVSGRQLKIEDDPAQGNEQVQLETENRLFFRRHFAISRIKRFPVACGSGNQIKLNDWQGQTVNHTLLILGEIHVFQDYFTDQIEGIHQVASAAIEAALRWHIWKQIRIFAPLAQHLCFQIPATAFADHSHADQFTVAANRFWPWAIKQRGDLFPNIIHGYENPQAKIRKIVYHWDCPPSLLGGCNSPI